MTVATTRARTTPAGRGPGVPAWRSTARVITVDLSAPLPDLVAAAPGEPEGFAVLVTMCQRPIGMVLLAGPMPAESLAAEVWGQVGDRAVAEARVHQLAPTSLDGGGWVHDQCGLRDRRARIVADGPAITVAVATRNRASALRTLLDSMAALDYRNKQLLVIDNNPSDESTLELVRSLPYELDYVREPVPGLAAARNRAVAEAAHPILAFLDDDEVVDPWWLSAIAEEFDADPAIGAVTGLVLPAELDTEAQVAFERVGGHTKGRGFERARFERDGAQSPYLPAPGFGAGANFAAPVALLKQIGGFDEALGAGTPTKGSEDTLAFTEVLLADRAIVYTPAAYTWHFHRRSLEELTSQLSGYGLGLGAFYTALVVRRPARLLGLLLTALRLVLGLVRRGPAAPAGEEPAFASRGSTLQRARDMLRGSLLYLRTRRR